MNNVSRLPLVFTIGAACAASAAHAQPAGQVVPATERAGGVITEREAPLPVVAAPVTAPSTFTLGGYGEAYYQWNLNDPTTDITNLRGFDNRHNSFTLSNVAFDAQWDDARLIGRLTLQVGHTPSTYYLSEPLSRGSAGANESDAELWKYLQQAYVGHRFGTDARLSVAAGLFLSPIGPESMAVKDNWNWSRSNLFFGLPFYHTGARATYGLTEDWSVTLAGYNGWNSVVDNNAEKSVSVQVVYTAPELTLSALYFGGVERPRGAPEGRAWRHLGDVNLTWNASPRLAFLAHTNGGFEPNEYGVSRWVAGALYGRVKVYDTLFMAARGDAFAEHRAHDGDGRASSIFWPAPWVASGTATVDFRPHPRVSFRLECRHDEAGAPVFFGRRAVMAEGGLYAANRRSQDTVTIGATSWF